MNSLIQTCYRVSSSVIAILLLLPVFCYSQETEYFKCPEYEFPAPEEAPQATCQTCDIDPDHPGFTCEIAIGKGTQFKSSSDIGPSISGNVCINGDFYVDAPFVFQDAIVRVCKGVAIIVEGEPLALGLTIDHSEFFSCTELWKGIGMLQNSVVTTRNNSKIEDAEVAINTGGFGLGGYLGRTLFIENTIFNRNRILLL